MIARVSLETRRVHTAIDIIHLGIMPSDRILLSSASRSCAQGARCRVLSRRARSRLGGAAGPGQAPPRYRQLPTGRHSASTQALVDTSGPPASHTPSQPSTHLKRTLAFLQFLLAVLNEPAAIAQNVWSQPPSLAATLNELSVSGAVVKRASPCLYCLQEGAHQPCLSYSSSARAKMSTGSSSEDQPPPLAAASRCRCRCRHSCCCCRPRCCWRFLHEADAGALGTPSGQEVRAWEAAAGAARFALADSRQRAATISNTAVFPGERLLGGESPEVRVRRPS